MNRGTLPDGGGGQSKMLAKTMPLSRDLRRRTVRAVKKGSSICGVMELPQELRI